MANIILLLIGAIAVTFWGLAHLIFTKGVVNDFGDISKDNKLIITMEWIVEGMALIFIGLLVILVTFLGGTGNIVTFYVNVIRKLFFDSKAIIVDGI